MTSTNPITYLTDQGLTVTLVDNKLNIKPTDKVTQEIANYLKANKVLLKEWLSIKNTKPLIKNIEPLRQLALLNAQQTTWFYNVANYLNYPPAQLLEQKAILLEDIQEFAHKDPLIIAECLLQGGLLDRIKVIDPVNIKTLKNNH